MSRTPATNLAALLMSVGLMLNCTSPSSVTKEGPPEPPLTPRVTPSMTSVVPNVGSTGGGTPVKISGTGFLSGVTVSVDGQGTKAVYESSISLQIAMPIHVVGAVDIVVTNPDGQSSRMSAAFTYAPPQSFDFNGTWVGVALAHPELGRSGVLHSDMELKFTIQNGVLTNIVCYELAETLTPSPPLVSDGAFSHSVDGRVLVSGRIVSPAVAIGTIDTLWCPQTRWSATRVP